MKIILRFIAMMDVLVMGLLAEGAMELLSFLGFFVFMGIGLGAAALFWAVAEYLEREVRHGDDR